MQSLTTSQASPPAGVAAPSVYFSHTELFMTPLDTSTVYIHTFAPASVLSPRPCVWRAEDISPIADWHATSSGNLPTSDLHVNSTEIMSLGSGARVPEVESQLCDLDDFASSFSALDTSFVKMEIIIVPPL